MINVAKSFTPYLKRFSRTLMGKARREAMEHQHDDPDKQNNTKEQKKSLLRNAG